MKTDTSLSRSRSAAARPSTARSRPPLGAGPQQRPVRPGGQQFEQPQRGQPVVHHDDASRPGQQPAQLHPSREGVAHRQRAARHALTRLGQLQPAGQRHRAQLAPGGLERAQAGARHDGRGRAEEPGVVGLDGAQHLER
ncbi:hypothetical protein [Nonomuraea salmonea]|uniref:hypothetical protein n=1 Tax=Nonomuraea salmonea TaxID=46181 RepID=UPI0031E956E8